MSGETGSLTPEADKVMIAVGPAYMSGPNRGDLHGSVQWQRSTWKADRATRRTAASAGFMCSGKQAKLCAAVESGYSHSAIKGGDAFGFRVGAGCNELLR